MTDAPATYCAPSTIYRDADGRPTFVATDEVLLVAGAALQLATAQELGLETLDFNAHWAARCAPETPAPADPAAKVTYPSADLS